MPFCVSFLCVVQMTFRCVLQTSGLVYTGAGNSTLQVFISAQPPAANSPQFANSLPAPNDAPFELIVRLYEPQSLVLAGEYEPSAVVRTT